MPRLINTAPSLIPTMVLIGLFLLHDEATVTSAINTASTAAQGLANQAYEAVMGGPTSTESK